MMREYLQSYKSSHALSTAGEGGPEYIDLSHMLLNTLGTYSRASWAGAVDSFKITYGKCESGLTVRLRGASGRSARRQCVSQYE